MISDIAWYIAWNTHFCIFDNQRPEVEGERSDVTALKGI